MFDNFKMFSFFYIFRYPPVQGFRGGVPPPPEFYKVITPSAFDLEQVIYDHQQVGQAGKNGDAPK